MSDSLEAATPAVAKSDSKLPQVSAEVAADVELQLLRDQLEEQRDDMHVQLEEERRSSQALLEKERAAMRIQMEVRTPAHWHGGNECLLPCLC